MKKNSLKFLLISFLFASMLASKTYACETQKTNDDDLTASSSSSLHIPQQFKMEEPKSLNESSPPLNRAGKNFLVVANGDWDEEIVRKYVNDRVIIALDGVASVLYERSIAPHFILGDFDSILEKYKENRKDYFSVESALKHFSSLPTPPDDEVQFEEYKPHVAYLANGEKVNVTYIRAISQNYTDLDKGVKFCLAQQKTPNEYIDITIACALGGDRVDHSLGNFTTLKKYKAPKYSNAKVKFVNKLQVVEFLRDEQTEFTGPIGAKFGLFGFPRALAISKGLKWELDHNYPLEIGKQESSCNELSSTKVKINIEGEALMMRPNTDFIETSRD